MAQTTANKSATQIKASSLRLLVLTPATEAQTSASPFPAFLQRLTGTPPSTDLAAFAGYTSHPPLYLRTRYYETNVSIWCDEIPPTSPQGQDGKSTRDQTTISTLSTPDEQSPLLTEWSEQMLSDSAKEVRDVIGGIVLLLPFVQPRSEIDLWLPYLEAVTALRDAIEDESGREVLSLVTLQNMSAAVVSNTSEAKVAEASLLEKVEDECLTTHGIMGWDYVLWNPNTDPPPAGPGSDPATATAQAQVQAQAQTQTVTFQPRNEHGEMIGFPRILEVLENTDWTAGPSSTDMDDIDSDLDDMLDNDADGGDLDDQSQYSYSDISRATLLSLQSMNPRSGMARQTQTDNVVQNDQHEFQREMLGLKMAMMDRITTAGPQDTSTSSLAGELDASDIGLRTPMVAHNRPSSKLARTMSATSTATGAGSVVARPGDEGGDEMQVEQLTGLMQRIVAMREAAGGMGEGDRERFARREVAKIMRDLK